MGQVICNNCFEVEDTTKRFIELPYVCDLCEKDSARAIEQDVWEKEYYIIQARSKSSNQVDDWFRSQNPNTKGIFDDYSTALEAADREQDGSRVEYRVVEYRPGPTPCDTPYNSGVPCQSALDSVEEQFIGEQDAHNNDILDQFDADTELINGLIAENAELRAQLKDAYGYKNNYTELFEPRSYLWCIDSGIDGTFTWQATS